MLKMVDIKVSSKVQMNRDKAESKLVKAMEGTVRSGETVAAQNAPVDTGRLKNSIKTRRHSKFSWSIQAGVKHALPVEFGTEPHTITPSDAQALFWEGADHPVKKVEHPGTPEQPFMRPALRHMVNIAPRTFEIYFKE